MGANVMKEHKWDDSVDESKDFIEATTVFPEEGPEVKINALSFKSDITKLRRRIEERLDNKRIDLEFNYEELDDNREEFS
jgi:hypothetical protein|tara:strand:- start:545 stop:784 length:240 start_codon:yes stop_codon:yes gene_type:complete